MQVKAEKPRLTMHGYNAPEGWTGEKDTQGNYILKEKTATGEEIVKTWVEYKSSAGDILWNGWVVEKTVGKGVPIVDFGSNDLNGPDIGFIKLMCSSTLSACENLPKFKHIDKTPENDADSDLTTRTVVLLYNRTHNGANPGPEEIGTLMKSFQDGFELKITPSGSQEEVVWKVGSDIGSVTIFTDWNSLEGSDEFNFGQLNIRSKILGIDKNGNLIGIIATDLPMETLNDFDMSRVILFQVAMALQQNDQSNITSYKVIDSMVNVADNLSSDGNLWIVRTDRK